jgi:hypothetical protein
MMSGITPSCSAPHINPVRPKPVIISSAMSNASCSRAISATPGRNSGGGMTLPAVPCMGSTRTAAIVPAVAWVICWRRKSRQAMPQLGYDSFNGQR